MNPLIKFYSDRKSDSCSFNSSIYFISYIYLLYLFYNLYESKDYLIATLGFIIRKRKSCPITAIISAVVHFELRSHIFLSLI